MANGSTIEPMSEIAEMITKLRGKGWTVAAIADELEVNYYTVVRWENGTRMPANAAGVRVILERLERRQRIPKQRRYAKKSPPASEG